MLDFDPVAALRENLATERRPPDGLLHPSGDLIGSLRHAQLRAAGAPTIDSDVVSDTRMMIGTLTHSWLERTFRSAPVMCEVKLDRWMPDGWTGTADAMFWNAERRAFVLLDYKTVKPEGIRYILKDGIKEEHLWQGSAYWWAAARMGIPLVNGFCVLYLPTQQLLARDGFVQPTLQEVTPLGREMVEGTMEERWVQTRRYLNLQPEKFGWINDWLAPVQEPVQKLSLNKSLKTPVIDVKLAPHWSAAYCPFPDELCNCRFTPTMKVGHWESKGKDLIEYVPRNDVPQPSGNIEFPSAGLLRNLENAVVAA